MRIPEIKIVIKVKTSKMGQTVDKGKIIIIIISKLEEVIHNDS